MVVRADLDGPVAGVGDAELESRSAGVDHDVAVRCHHLARHEGGPCAADRLVHRDELGAVGKRRLDLDVGDHRGDAIHDLVGSQDMGASLHQLGDGTSVARAFNDEVGDERDGFGVVEPDAAGQALARDLGRHRDQELVLLACRQVHDRPIARRGERRSRQPAAHRPPQGEAARPIAPAFLQR